VPKGYTQRGRKGDHSDPVKESAPTDHPPGSPEKVEEMRRRVAAGQAPTNPLDATESEEKALQGRPTSAGRNGGEGGRPLVERTVVVRRRPLKGRCRPQAPRYFGGRLHYYRTLRRMSQEQLAHAAGCHPKYLSDLERSTRYPAAALLLSLARALDVPPDELLGYKKPSLGA
jgi:DNA-binding XRE family transcriptional regulator